MYTHQADGIIAGRGLDNVIPIRRKRRFVAVTGGKGGVGKSTIAVNLAAAYAQGGSSTLAIDADFGMADLNLLLSVAPERSLLDAVFGADLADVLIERHGISLLPALNGSHLLANPDRVTRQRIREVISSAQRRFDATVIDAPAGIEDCAVSVAAMADAVVLVSTAEPLAIADAYASLKVLTKRHGLARAYLLPNRVSSEAESAELTQQLGSLVDHFLGIELVELPSIPADGQARMAAATGAPIVLTNPDAAFSRAIARVVRALDAHLGTQRFALEAS